MSLDPTLILTSPCSFCEKDVPLHKRGLKTIPQDRNIYCDKICMGKAQTKRATIECVCSYCNLTFTTLRGRHDESHQFCSQECALKVRMDRYFWSICQVLSEHSGWLSADMIRMRLRMKKVDLTAMRIATRIAQNHIVEVNSESEPFQYRMKDEYRHKPYTWHSNKFFRKIERERNDYVIMFESTVGNRKVDTLNDLRSDHE